MPAAFTIPLCSFDMSFVYDQPVVSFMADPAPLIREVFAAYAPWKPNFDDIQFPNEGKNSDRGVNFKIASQNASLFVGPAHSRFVKETANWAEADLIESLMQAGLSAIRRVAELNFRSQHTVLSMHVQPTIVPFRDIIRKALMTERIVALDAEPTNGMAMILKWPSYRVTIDGSAAIANGIYLQLERDFGGQATFDEVKTAIRADQLALYDLLDFKEELPV